MAITNLDQVITGMRPPEELYKNGSPMEGAGILHSFFYTSGRPGAAAVPSPGIAGAALTNYLGQIPWVNPVTGNSYLARLQASASQSGCLLLFDRLWHNSGIVVTTTTAQTINSVAWPARDRDGDVLGEGVLVGIEVSTATTNAGAIANTTLSYTNQANVSGRTATMASFPATAVAGTFVQFQLQAGDTGIRSIQSITLGTSYVTGAIHLVAYRQLARLELALPNIGNSIDAVTGGFVRCYDNSVLYLVWLAGSAANVNVFGQLIITQG